MITHENIVFSKHNILFVKCVLKTQMVANSYDYKFLSRFLIFLVHTFDKNSVFFSASYHLKN